MSTFSLLTVRPPRPRPSYAVAQNVSSEATDDGYII